MPITMDDYIRKIHKRWIEGATLDERLEGVPAEQILGRLTPEQRLEGIPAEQRLAGLTPEEREKLRKLLQELPSV